MSLASLIQAAILLLTLVNTTPSLPPELKAQAISTAQLAIQTAVSAENQATSSESLPITHPSDQKSWTNSIDDFTQSYFPSFSGTADVPQVYVVLSVGNPQNPGDAPSGETALLNVIDGKWKTNAILIHGWGNKDIGLPAGQYKVWLYSSKGDLLTTKTIVIY